MKVKEIIFEEVKRYKLNVGHAWPFGNYSSVWGNSYPPIKPKEFFDEMEKLVNEGLFEIGYLHPNDNPIYKLTQKGFDIIWENY